MLAHATLRSKIQRFAGLGEGRSAIDHRQCHALHLRSLHRLDVQKRHLLRIQRDTL